MSGGDAMDYYDVERMVREAVDLLRYRIIDLEREIKNLHEAIGSERVDRQDAVAALDGVLQSRTEHLA